MGNNSHIVHKKNKDKTAVNEKNSAGTAVNHDLIQRFKTWLIAHFCWSPFVAERLHELLYQNLSYKINLALWDTPNNNDMLTSNFLQWEGTCTFSKVFVMHTQCTMRCRTRKSTSLKGGLEYQLKPVWASIRATSATDNLMARKESVRPACLRLKIESRSRLTWILLYYSPNI